MDNTIDQNTSHSHDDIGKLARWLQDVMQTPSTPAPMISAPPTPPHSTTRSSITGERDIQLELVLQNSSYHKQFYQQIPDFVLALLKNDSQAATHYAPLLYHLAGCPVCHQAYLEIYDALRAALFPHEPRPILGQGTRTLDATPQRMLAHLCQAWITQAEAILQQARHDDTDDDASARILLQAAIHMSSHIKQDAVRQQARHDLVRVATLFDTQHGSQSSTAPAEHTFTPVLAGGKGVVRRGDKTNAKSKETGAEPAAIVLQSRSLEGHIIQRGQRLELHLQALEESLRGHYITTSIALGSLIEPIRWSGGNPRAIRSTAPVEANGALVMTLGETDLNLNVPEEHNLLETTFSLIKVRVAD